MAEGSSARDRSFPAGSAPKLMAPGLATLVDRAPQDARWLHEIKRDGYRLIAYPAPVEHHGQARALVDTNLQ
jgi:ATP-dependent DNA ligase